MIKPAPKQKKQKAAYPVAAGRLKSFVERVEKLEEERGAIGGDIRDVISEAKGAGYDAKTIRWLIQERKIESADRDERDALRDTYAHALGMAVDLVRVEGLSLREAERQSGVSKSVIHRALSVPALSQAASEASPAQTNNAPAGFQVAPEAWAFVTARRDEIEAEKAAQREAERERRRAQRAAFDAMQARVDSDPLHIPADLLRARVA